ncbi:MAG: transglutaminase domain-containing protein, partial [Woeseiaceae bacterium]
MLLLVALVSGYEARAAEPELRRVIAAIDAGQFASAEATIADALERPVDEETRAALLFQRERMRRILIDFSLDADAVKTRVRKSIPDLTDAEFARWDSAGLFERQVIDGHVLYFNRSPSNLFRLSAEARARRSEQTPLVDGPMETPNAHHRAVRETALVEENDSVLPQRVRVTQSLTVNADAVPAGETVRVWIPVPRALPGQQEDIRFLDSEPATHEIAPESVMQRTVYLEKEAEAGQPTAFSINYELTIFGQHHAVDADKVKPATITAELAPFVAERAPHIMFNESLRLMSEQIVGDETNPWRIAQKLFAAVDRIPWAGARDYSTIT